MGYIARLGPADALPAEGVYSGAIARSTGISEDQIRDGIESLVQEGHLYSTSDDDQYVIPLSSFVFSSSGRQCAAYCDMRGARVEKVDMHCNMNFSSLQHGTAVNLSMT